MVGIEQPPRPMFSAIVKYTSCAGIWSVREPACQICVKPGSMSRNAVRRKRPRSGRRREIAADVEEEVGVGCELLRLDFAAVERLPVGSHEGVRRRLAVRREDGVEVGHRPVVARLRADLLDEMDCPAETMKPRQIARRTQASPPLCVLFAMAPATTATGTLQLLEQPAEDDSGVKVLLGDPPRRARVPRTIRMISTTPSAASSTVEKVSRPSPSG